MKQNKQITDDLEVKTRACPVFYVSSACGIFLDKYSNPCLSAGARRIACIIFKLINEKTIIVQTSDGAVWRYLGNFINLILTFFPHYKLTIC
jgi:hypothetical protein